MASNRTFGYHAALATAQVGYRCLFDNINGAFDLDLQRRVVEVVARASLDARLDRLVEATDRPDKVSARTER